MKVGLLSKLKRFLVPVGTKPRRVLFGPYRGLVFELDLQDRTQLMMGLWERETYRSIQEASRSANWMIDVGAGRGELCLFFLKHTNASPVIAVEPALTERLLMAQHLQMNGLDKTDRLLWIEKFIEVLPDEGGVPLDSLPVDRKKWGFLKIDVDGAEMEVLRSGRSLLSEGRTILLIETHSFMLEEECLSYLRLMNYECRVLSNAWWRILIPENRPIGHNRWIFAKPLPQHTVKGVNFHDAATKQGV